MYAHRWTGGALVAILALACSDDGKVLAPNDASEATLRLQQEAPTRRPFQGHFAGTTAPGALCGEKAWEMMILCQGRGTATHLGNATLDLSACWDMAAFLPAGPVSATYTSANGDQIAMTANDFGIDSQTGVMTGTFIIDGGTGRFGSAAGELLVTGQHFPDNTWTSQVTGWITY